MTRAAWLALTLGVALFVALLAWHGFGDIARTVSVAGWGVLLVAAFHLVPLVFDAAAIDVLFSRDGRTPVRSRRSFRAALLARWSGESVNSLMPAGQLGGPVLMVRYLAQRGASAADAAAVITVSTTWQTIAQMIFAILGIGVFVAGQAGATAADGPLDDLRLPLVALLAAGIVMMFGFYQAQRRGLFSRMTRLVAWFAARVRRPGDWSQWLDQAGAIDAAVGAVYRAPRQILHSFALSLIGWVVGTAEVWLALKFLGHPVSWTDALLLESLGQAIRGAVFIIPGSLGVQEGGYLLLATLVGLPPDAALALSLIKRAREILLGLPGLVYLHWSERGWQRRRMAARVQVAE